MERLSDIINDVPCNSRILLVTHLKLFICIYIFYILELYNKFQRNMSSSSESEITQALQLVKVMFQFLALRLF